MWLAKERAKMSEDAEILRKLDERMKLLRAECWKEISESADAKPIYTLLRLYSKLKMFCEFYDSLRKPSA